MSAAAEIAGDAFQQFFLMLLRVNGSKLHFNHIVVLLWHSAPARQARTR